MAGWRERSPRDDSGSGRPGAPKAGPAKAAAPKKDWRKAGAAGGAASDRQSKSWQATAAAGGGRLSHRMRLGLWGAALASLVGAWVWYVFFSPKKTPVVAVVVSDYNVLIPPNAYAREDVERLSEANLKNIEIQTDYRDHGAARRFQEYLHRALQVKPGGPQKNVVIVYLSAHGVVNKDGEPCLLLADSEPLRESTWLPVSDFFAMLADHPQLAPATRKVVILDSTRMLANWRLGLLHNSFADQLPQVVSGAKVKNLYVINSTSGDQRGHAAPELGGSVFGYFVARGLHGDADHAEHGGDDNQRVSLHELRDYLAAQVRQWVSDHRTDVQVPQLVGSDAADFNLVFADPAPQPAWESQAKQALEAVATDRMTPLGDLWLRHAQLSKSGAALADPLAWSELEYKLLRLEELALAGQAYDEEFEKSRTAAADLLGRVGPHPLPKDLVAGSLPLADQLSTAEAREERRQARETAIKAWQRQAGKPKAGAATPAPADRFEAAAIGLDWLSRHATLIGRSQIAEVLGYVDQAAASPTGKATRIEPVEVHFLRMLNAHVDWEAIDGNNADAAHQRLQRAIRARQLAEQVATPTDARVHYWSQATINAADDQRRASEDAVFVDVVSAPAAADGARLPAAEPPSASDAYHVAQETAAQVTAAFHTRDRAYAELPYLVQWSLDGLAMGKQPPADVLTLVAALHRLSSTLDAELAAGQWTEDDEQMHKSVRDAVDRFKTEGYLARCEYLRVEAGKDRQILREIGSALQSPLLSGERRNELRRKYLEILLAEAGEKPVAAPHASGAATVSDAKANDAYLTLLTVIDEHPALQILNRESLSLDATQYRPIRRFQKLDAAATREQRLARLADEGHEIRELLDSVRVTLDKLAAETNSRLQQTPPESPAVVRAALSKADRLSRAAASQLAQRTWDDAEIDPAHLLRKVDLHFEYLWHCHRALDDFWGPAPDQTAPYFAAASQGFLTSAKILCRQATADTYGGERLAMLREARLRGAQQGIVPRAEQRSGPQSPTAPQQLVVTPAVDVPPGRAALFVLTDNRQTLPLADGARPDQAARRQGVPVGKGAGGHTYIYRFPDDPALARLDAFAVYRGHRRSAPLPPPPAAPGKSRAIEVALDRPPYPAPQVRVQGDAVRVPEVMFVLDCSGSMTELVGQGDGQRTTRMRAATDTLNRILTRLQNSNYRIGLMLYGHRAGWKKGDEPGKFEVRLADGAPPNLHPSADVEARLGIANLTDDLRSKFQDILAGVTPIGETPLYYALSQALLQFPRNNRKAPQQIILITDGLNDQFRDKLNPGPADAYKIREDIDNMLERGPFQGIRVDIVGFNMVGLKANEQRGVDDLRAVAKRTGGRFHDAQNPDTLLAALQELLHVVEFSVRRADTPTATDLTPLPLGKIWEVEEFRGEADYSVDLHGADKPVRSAVHLEGGEALEMFYNSAQGQLEHRRLSPGPHRDSREKLLDPVDSQASYFVGAHLPVRRSPKDVSFLVSIQNQQERKFSRRPRNVWAEITPVFTQEPEQKPIYHFYDLDFEIRQPVPMLKFHVPQWPADSDQAQIKLWFKVQGDVKPNHVERADPTRTQSFEIDGVQFKIEARREAGPDAPYRVEVSETHPAGTDLYTMRVEAYPPPERIRHRYLTDDNAVQHVFEYPTTRNLTQQPEVRITSRERITKDAVEIVEKPLQVIIGD